MIDNQSNVSISKQCHLLSVSRSSYYYQSKGESADNLELMSQIDKQFLQTPYYGVQQMTYHFRNEGINISPKRIRRLMRLMGLQAIYQAPNSSSSNPEHPIYPYLLRNMVIKEANKVWCSDITYIRMKKGFLYLVAVMDWHTRKVLSWCLSNSMDSSFCIDAVKESMDFYGKPEIFNTDQGSQFTASSFTGLLQSNKIKISMDGKGAWRDNVFIERLWRSLKYECVYLHEFVDGLEARDKIGQWINHYNSLRPHSFHGGKTPDMVYFDQTSKAA